MGLTFFSKVWINNAGVRLGSSFMLVMGLAGSVSSQTLTQASEASVNLTCNYLASSVGYRGTCVVPCSVNALAVDFNGVNQAKACNSAPRIVDSTLIKTEVAGRWLGTMQGVKPEDPTRFEVVPGKEPSGNVARTPFGWFEVTRLSESLSSLSLVINVQRQIRPDSDDLAILDRAIALLPSLDRWNKNDNRECLSGAASLSLFCALMQATTEIAGGVHYRQPAMQAVREELNLVDRSRINTHRIMDYNNHPATTLEEVHALLRRAKLRVLDEIR